MLALPAVALAQEAPVEAWRVSGFQAPESVVLDRDNQLLYVSNVNGSPTEADGNGYISQLSPDGTLMAEKWVTGGLNAPTGMDVQGGNLYVADIQRLVVIDIASGEISATHEAPDARFLNDVTSDDQGRVYVSAMMTNSIWRLAEGRFEPWLQSEELMSPNGLFAAPDRLVVATWGERTEGFQTSVPGRLKAVSYDDQGISDIGAGAPVGNLDGVEPDGTGAWLATDWMAGALYHIHADGTARQVLDLPQGSADLEHVADRNLVIVPLMNDGEVAAWRWSPPMAAEASSASDAR